jgi:GNAT superfamily N-acetyltransferase
MTMSASSEIHTCFRPLTAEDHEPVARLLHAALVNWYETRLGQGARFGDSHQPFLLFPEVYEALDPGECVVATDPDCGGIVGVCFSHQRETHIAVGIVATSPVVAGRGVARRMMELVLEKSRALGKPVRLVSSLLNLDSFSLYTRMGFVPGTVFQDLLITVPSEGMGTLAAPPPGASAVREAGPEDVARIADFELEWQGIRREKDFSFFLRNEAGAWRLLVSEDSQGAVSGFLGMSIHPSFTMIGPGLAAGEADAVALLWSALDGLRGKTLVFLAPAAAAGLVRECYRWGARNVELHVAQNTSPAPVRGGVVFPTFMPETG